MTDIVELSDSDGDGSDGHAWVPKYHDVRSFEALKVLGAHACRKIIGAWRPICMDWLRR